MDKEEVNLKERYSKVAREYDLPEFEEIIDDFDIEKIQDKEITFFVREIRRAMNEKIVAYIHLFETLINPAGTSIFVFSILRNLSTEDKETIKKIYKALSRTQLDVMKLDTIHKEDEEAKFINETFIIWQELKPQIYKLIKGFESGFDEDDVSKKRSYFD